MTEFDEARDTTLQSTCTGRYAPTVTDHARAALAEMDREIYWDGDLASEDQEMVLGW